MSFEPSNLITDVWEGIRPDLIPLSTHGKRRGEALWFTQSSVVTHSFAITHTHTHTWKPSYIQWPAGVETFRSSISTVIGRSRRLMWSLKGAGQWHGEREWEISHLQQCFISLILTCCDTQNHRNPQHCSIYKHEQINTVLEINKI